MLMSSCGARLRSAAYKFVQPIASAATATTQTQSGAPTNTQQRRNYGLRDDLRPANVAVDGVAPRRAFNTASSVQHPDVLTKNKATRTDGVPAERFPFTEPVRFEQRMKKLTRFVMMSAARLHYIIIILLRIGRWSSAVLVFRVAAFIFGGRVSLGVVCESHLCYQSAASPLTYAYKH